MKRGKNVFIEDTHMETQTTFHADGRINIYPCGFELGQRIVADGDSVSQKGRMVTDDNGSSRFRPYRQNSGSRYTQLMLTKHGVMKRSMGQLIVRLALPLKMKPKELATVLMAEALEMALWLEGKKSKSLKPRAVPLITNH